MRSRGLEPPRLAALTPQASASTNSATTARQATARTSSKLGRREQAAPHRPGPTQSAAPPRRPIAPRRPGWPSGGRIAIAGAATAQPSADPDASPMASAPIPPVEWLVSRRARPLRGGVRVHGAARRCHRRRHRRRARLAARASAALHRRHQRQGRRPASSRGAFPSTASGRGGQFTYHGPGQRVGYVMLDVGRRFGDVRAYVAALEALIIEALAALGVEAHARSGLVGVWVRRQRGGPRAARQDRGHRRAAAPLGELARLQHQRGAGPGALLRHRAVRHPRRRGHEPRRARRRRAGLPALDARAARAPSSAASARPASVARRSRAGARAG